jgi:hypothetical protein
MEELHLPSYIEGRDEVLRALREELVGPSSQGREIDCSRNISFDDVQQSYGPWCQLGSREEILQRDPPCKRYGIGVLYPLELPADDETIEDQSLETLLVPAEGEKEEGILTPLAQRAIEQIEKRPERVGGEAGGTEADTPLANGTRPSSMGISFLADLPLGAILTVEASGGRYRKHIIHVQGQERTWWLRSTVLIGATFDAGALCSPREAKVSAREVRTENVEGLDIHVEVFSRPYHLAGKRLVTVCLVNRSTVQGSFDQNCLFQSSFKVSIISPGETRHICPYPGSADIGIDGTSLPSDKEEESLALLYRRAKTFAVGHSCSADWESLEGTWQRQFTNNKGFGKMVPAMESGNVAWVRAESLPAIEIPSTTPNVRRRDGSVVEVDMAPLAGLAPGNDGIASLEEVTSLYEEWIEQKTQEIATLDPGYHRAAWKHIDNCKKCVNRMRRGLHYLETTPIAKRAFQLANYAMLLQQIHAGREPRKYLFDPKTATVNFSSAYSMPDPAKPQGGRGKWRAFQVAFLLMAIQSTADGQSEDRELVELIWFPTGGGKTEAYLGLAAFSMFMRRLENKDDAGVQVLMRYTLRLLTAQQFQRASSLICAMEHLRRKNNRELGEHEFSIGIWLGNATTPNKREEAIRTLNGLVRNEKYAENKFLVNKCPWCRAQIGPVKSAKAGRGKSESLVPGYTRRGNTVAFQCPDSKCEFSRGLPIYVIDEDIYEKRPTMLIGTVDKFAQVAWNEKVRSIFGIDMKGVRECTPPNLIIQDELHLISGPLGSMVGIYETIIEELCTDRRYGKATRPKIVSSTATIRRYEEQVHRLYGRSDVALFPPPGLGADDSFFARFATNAEGKLERGRIYIGVHAPGLGSLQTVQVRSFTALLQAPLALKESARDPWWTLLIFFNSLRELGTTLSLFQSDIPDYFRVLMNRSGTPLEKVRKFWNILELTGRLQNDEVPEAISKLEVEYEREGQTNYPVDVCLASNIIEVGVDIDRLSLMTVVGQPKTTSQYIQVTGRVGRLWDQRPGLVVTLYGPTRPRDRSHYEKFRSYHERLYAQVEPTSVTPFSPPVLDRALHAVMVAYVRQFGNKDNARSPYPYPEQLIEQLRQIVLPRVQAIDPGEFGNFTQVFERRINQWKTWGRSVWDKPTGTDLPLLLSAGAYINPDQKRLVWQTANSMRNVDAQCDAVITGLYAQMEEDLDND